MSSKCLRHLVGALTLVTIVAMALSEAKASFIQAPLAGAANNNLPDATQPAAGLIGGRRMPPDPVTPLGFFCSGSLIDSNIKPARSFALTAAHCVSNVLPAVGGGARDLRDDEGRFQVGGPTGAVRPSDRVRYHTTYNFPDRDIGLMRLDQLVANVVPYQIKRDAVAATDAFNAIGFGHTGYNVATVQNFGFQTKRQGSYAINVVQAGGDGQANYYEFNNGAAPLRHLCQGDSGGPSLFGGKVGGVHSWVSNPGAGGGFSPCDGNNTNNADANVTEPFMYNWIDSYSRKAIFWDQLNINAGAEDDDFEPSPLGYDYGDNGFREGWSLVNVMHPDFGQIVSDPDDWRYFNAIGIDNDHVTNELYLDGLSSQGEILLNDEPSVIAKTFTLNIPVDPNLTQLCMNMYGMQNCGSANVDVHRRWNSLELGDDVGVGVAGGPIRWAGVLQSSVVGGIDQWSFRTADQIVPAGMQDINVYLLNVPEPGTLVLLAVGSIGLLHRPRRHAAK